MYKHLLVPVDGTKLSLKALDEAGTLAKALGSKITAVTVSPVYPMLVSGDGYVLDLNSPSEWETTTAKQADRIRLVVEKRAAAKGLKVAFVTVTFDGPYLGIIETARKKKCDLIVMASHGRRGFSGFLLGSETTKVLTHSKIPVLVCR
jgi:nucleotide-binding universal stress UspA family protein